ncbi:hypothetical protein K450DRAFT_248196 [Umbelopsis ramanniana AG]|uniref:Ceramide glucosyltransferase n=1 Tax=Umbelopsis ramanniana AG TaxID=1314678 RepID=A0AAD5E727_UMBRA|nr:uncharacterized protein K450DRAFT_248196 [Umbelopsis ramanniana AG]KAI8578303.1 hypothetical protein K450DRAFT_248196 [Umbelopsis ramanniana AG]
MAVLDTIIYYFSWLCVLWYTFMALLSLLGLTVSRCRYTKKDTPKSPSMLTPPSVSILRPLKGLDINLRENLLSSFCQNYPAYEIIFSVAKEDDPAIPVVKELMEEHPEIETRLIIGDVAAGINPKINNLIKSYDSAQHDILWILDSNVQVHADALARSVDAILKPKVGLVHHLPLATNPSSYGAEVEQVFLDTNHAKMYIAINFVAVASCIMGKSNLWRKSDLEKAGGLRQFAQYMAEDNIIAEALWAQGLKHVMTCDTANQSLGSLSPKDYCLRRSRWVRVRKYIVTAATLVEPITESIICGLMGAFGYSSRFGVSFGLFFLIHWLCWFLCDYTLYHTFLGSAQLKPQPLLHFVRAWFSREILALPLYVYAMVGDKIVWRGELYELQRDGTGVKVSKKDSFAKFAGVL